MSISKSDNENNPLTLDKIIDYMKRTKAEDWQTDVCRSRDGTKHCFFSHLFNMGGNFFWEMFESLYATTYMIYPVNDGENKNYPQEEIKDRCIAYLKDLRDGKAKTVRQLMDEYENS